MIFNKQRFPASGFAVCAFFVVVAGLAHSVFFWHRWPQQAQVSPALALYGEAALQQLKSDGGFASLAAAMTAARYQVNTAPTQSAKTDALFYADNPAQRLRATFAPDEVRVNAASNKPDGKAGGAELRLRLAGYGYGDRLAPLTPGALNGDGDRVEIAKSAIRNPQSAITEWYVNKPEGLEQGFTLAAPPAPRKIGEWLRVVLTVGEGWRIRLRGDGQGALFERQADGVQFGYDHLLASDAQGRTLPARMALEGETLALVVDDAAAVYPLTIDPLITQQQKLTAADGAANDQFGSAVALSGNTAVIGAPFDAIGGNADQGSAYVFVRTGTVWTQQQKLTANDGAAGDLFGHAVAVSGDTVVVGANADDVNGNKDQGSAYVFVRSGTTWTQQQQLTANDGAASDDFGRSVGISGDTVIVGADKDDIGANADQGSAYVFVRSGTTWSQQKKLTADDGAASDFFGFSVAVSGDTAAVGAFGKDGANATNGGAAYVFVRTGADWTKQQQLTAIDLANGDSFGISVAISGDTVVVGTPGDTIGLNGFQGSAYVFVRSGTVWTQQKKLIAPDGSAVDFFGTSVAVSGDIVVVGANADDLGSQDQGSAYVFARSGTTWSQVRRPISEDGKAGDNFGVSVAVSGGTVVVGAWGSDLGANTDQGAAYVFVVCDNNLIQQPQLIANDGLANHLFGASVAVSGDTLVVGAPKGGFGSNPNQGAAYVFVRGGAGGWMLQQKLFALDGAFSDLFGNEVAISGNTIVVGAPGAKIGANIRQGAAYVFVRNGTAWNLQQKLIANDGKFDDGLGGSVGVSGDTIVIGAGFADVGGNVNQGLAYIFTRSGTVWTQQPTLIASDGAANHQFGRSVAVSGDTAVIGAFGDGSAYIYVNNGLWQRQSKLGPSDAGAFGLSVAISGDTVVVGANSTKIGQNVQQGAAYVFTRSGTFWSLQQKLFDSNGAANVFFGVSVGISGDTVVAGVPFDKVGANAFQGSSCVFTRSGTVWTQQPKLTANDGATNDQFGTSVAVSGDTVVAGAPFDDIDTRADQGSAYAFNCPACPTVTLTPATLPGAVIDNLYSQSLTASGGVGPYQFSLSDGALPPGLVLAQNGQLSGTPTATGTYRFTITATILSSLCTGSRSYTLTVTSVCPTITVNPPTLPAGASGAAYQQTVTASGGAAPYSFSLSAGALPTGLSLAANGALSGMPSVVGSFNFVVRAIDANGCQGNRGYTLTINEGTANNGLQFYPLAHPVRLLDTRSGQTGCFTPGAPITGGTSRTQAAQGLCDGLGIPNNAKAITGNITTVQSGGGFITLYPSDAAQPLVANSNYAPNEIINNVFTVGLGADGAFKIFALNTTDVVVDVTGYYAPPAAEGLFFHPLPHPIRLLDTRAGATGCTTPGAPLAGNTDTPQLAHLTCDGVTIPDAARAVVGNVTTVNPQGPGFPFLTLFPAGATRPLVASSNYLPGQVMNAPFTVGLSAVGEFKIFPTTQTDLVIDVLGYYSAQANDENGAGLLFNPLPQPVRLLETRAGGVGCSTPNAPLTTGSVRNQQARGACGGQTITNSALAIVGNATVINDQAGFLTFWPNGALQPLVATSNFTTGQILNRHFTVGLGATGVFNIFASAQTDLIVDVSGYFAP